MHKHIFSIFLLKKSKSFRLVNSIKAGAAFCAYVSLSKVVKASMMTTTVEASQPQKQPTADLKSSVPTAASTSRVSIAVFEVVTIFLRVISGGGHLARRRLHPEGVRSRLTS